MRRMSFGVPLGLPADFNHPDRGCEVHPRCLECPLPACKYDDLAGYRRQLRRSQDLQIFRAVVRRRFSQVQAADHFGVSRRTVQRVLQRVRAEGVA
jgi:hypothetical protein